MSTTTDNDSAAGTLDDELLRTQEELKREAVEAVAELKRLRIAAELAGRHVAELESDAAPTRGKGGEREGALHEPLAGGPPSEGSAEEAGGVVNDTTLDVPSEGAVVNSSDARLSSDARQGGVLGRVRRLSRRAQSAVFRVHRAARPREQLSKLREAAAAERATREALAAELAACEAERDALKDECKLMLEREAILQEQLTSALAQLRVAKGRKKKPPSSLPPTPTGAGGSCAFGGSCSSSLVSSPLSSHVSSPRGAEAAVHLASAGLASPTSGGPLAPALSRPPSTSGAEQLDCPRVRYTPTAIAALPRGLPPSDAHE